MKILIGVCGIGKGHCIRQFEISKELIKRGHDVRILTYNEGVDFFKKTNLKTYNVYVPIILFKGEKINWIDCIKRNIFKFIPGVIKNRKIFRKLIKDGFIPDLCISDYEPVVARISYKLNKPLINVDQHSKFIYIKEDEINGFSCVEEKRRLKLFFPKSEKKYSVSFYKISKDLLPPNVEILYPIIREDLKIVKKDNINTKTVIVYFSKFIDIPIEQKMEEIIEIFNKFEDYKFIIFSSEHYNLNLDKGNVEIRKNDREDFVKNLGNCYCVISTAGHTLISEAFYCGVPIFAIPLPSFDQNYCAKFIKENEVGYSSNVITYENLTEFLHNIKKYKENIKKCPNLVEKTDTITYLVDEIEKISEGR